MINLVHEIVLCYKAGGKVLICGNGGLAAEAEHFMAELMGKFSGEVFIPCISLTVPSSLITALSNDYGFNEVFAHQIRTLGKKGDVLIAMTTSKSANIWFARDAAVKLGLVAIILDRSNIEGKDTAEVQENIIKYLHRVAKEVKELIMKLI